MALRKFGPNEIVLNTMRTYPHVEYTIYDGVVYYNNTPRMSGSRSNNGILGVATGGISLYEYNIDRAPVDTGRFVPQYWDNTNEIYIAGEGSVADTGMIYPFITKDSARSSFKTIGKVSYTNEFANHDVLTANYPLSGTIAREMMWWPAERRIEVNNAGFPTKVVDLGAHQDPSLSPGEYYTTPYHPHFYALKNRLNHYGYLSPYYRVNSSYGDGWDKSTQPLGLISVPAIAFGSKIQPGSISLKWYYTGSLLGELRDTKHNGELIETIGEYSGAVAGVCMYSEGFMVLTGAWVIPGAKNQIHLDPISGVDWPRWYYFGAGAYDGMTSHLAGYGSFVTASFNMSFKGQTDIQVYTMFANAKRGEVNYSNNRTFFEHGQQKMRYSSSTVYEENANRKIKNTVSSSYLGYDAPFKRQVFISKVGIFDDSHNLIGIATLADPVLKKEDEDYTFKIKLDI